MKSRMFVFSVFVCIISTFMSAMDIQASTDWINVQKKSGGAVVQVFNDSLPFEWLAPYETGKQEKRRGSGFFIDNNGSVITNYHVVAGQCRVQISVSGLSRERFEAEVVGLAPNDDLALIRLTPESKKKVVQKLGAIPFLRFGDSDVVKRGRDVLLLGYPLGQENPKGTQGVISGWEMVNMPAQEFHRLCFQTTAASNPGNSGGALVDKNGNVIGVLFCGVDKAQNTAYAIPISGVRHTIKSLYKGGLVKRDFLGARHQLMTPVLSKVLGLQPGHGVLVESVSSCGLAVNAGVKPGDVFLELNGYPVDQFGNVRVPWAEDPVSSVEVVSRVPFGENITYTAMRNGKILNLQCKAGKGVYPAIHELFPGSDKIDCEVLGSGVVVMELSIELIRLLMNSNNLLCRYGLEPEMAENPVLVVTKVLASSEADDQRVGLYPGVILKEVNGTSVSTLMELRCVLNKELRNSEFIKIKTNSGTRDAFLSDDVIRDSMRLSKMFKFDSSNSVSLAIANENIRSLKEKHA